MKPDRPMRLEVDAEFKRLIRPLRKEEYRILENSIRKDGCRDPIIVWNNTIIDGHNRYLLCHRYNIPFAIEEKFFMSREDVIVWIAANQLRRKNISEEARKYLIGKMFEAEKIIGRRKQAADEIIIGEDVSDEVPYDEPSLQKRPRISVKNPTAERIGLQYHISHGTVEKYGAYSRAMDSLEVREPNIVRGILSGIYKVSHDNVIALSRMEDDELHKYSRKLRSQQKLTPFVPYHVSSDELKDPVESKPFQPEIKKMPVFDPDAEIVGLALTIPSWASTIERVRQGTNLHTVSEQAKQNLIRTLISLTESIHNLMTLLREGPEDEQ